MPTSDPKVVPFDQIEAYVARLLAPAMDRKALAFFSETRNRGFVFQNDGGELDVTFSVEWREQGDLEAAVRSFFASRGTAVWRDYLAGNSEPEAGVAPGQQNGGG